MTHTVNGVVWRNRRDRAWAYFLLEYTEIRIRLEEWFEARR